MLDQLALVKEMAMAPCHILRSKLGQNIDKGAICITLELDYMSLFPKISFSYTWIFSWNLLQLVIKNG
jgi:hypothetical protein